MKALELEMTLPIGFSSKGQEFREFELRPVKGRLRRDYLNLRKRSPARETFVALKHIVAKLGPLDIPSDAFLRKLTLPDVDYIFLLVSMHESDNGNIAWKHVCDETLGGCGNESDLSVDPKEIDLIDGSPPIQFTDDGSPIQITEFQDPVLKTTAKIVFLSLIHISEPTRPY